MRNAYSYSSLEIASRVAAGIAGIFIALLTLWGRLNISVRWQFLFSGLLAVALTTLGFGVGVFLLELCVWLFKRGGMRRKNIRAARLPVVGEEGHYFGRARPSGRGGDVTTTPFTGVRTAQAAHSSRWILPTFLSIGAAAVLTSGAMTLFGGTDDDEQVASSRNDEQHISKEQIRETMDRLSRKMTYLSVADAGSTLTLLNSDGTPAEAAKAQYIVSVNDKYVGKISIFRKKDYFMPSTPLKIDPEVRDLCVTIDKTLEGQDEILKALQDAQIKANLSLSFWKVVDAGIEVNPPKAWLVELAALLRAVSGLPAKRVEVLIKGYADGQTRPWTASLRPAPYDYRVVNVYPRAESDRLDSFSFIREEKPKYIPEEYSNGHLPELRAKFVEENFIGSFLGRCKGKTETEMHILEGYADNSKVIVEQDRRVEIFINIY